MINKEHLPSRIEVSAAGKPAGTITPGRDGFYFNYFPDAAGGSPVSLTMPFREKTWEWRHRLHPVFEMNLPEGYLFEIFKGLLQKEFGTINDFLLLSVIGANIRGYLTYRSDRHDSEVNVPVPELREVIASEDDDLFAKLLKMFLFRSGVSGVHPKVLATLKDKSKLNVDGYIVKTFGDEFPFLAENEFFCLEVLKKALVPVPEIYLSRSKKLLIVKRFDIGPDGTGIGFEEICTLQAKNQIDKYNGSYESIARSVDRFASSDCRVSSLKQLFKQTVLTFMLKNGDGHLKNFGILYTGDLKTRYISPAYDMVTTTAYLFRDKPALALCGKRIWHEKKTLIEFGAKYCLLSNREALEMYDECLAAVCWGRSRIRSYIRRNPSFSVIGGRMLDCWGGLGNESL